MVMHETTVYIIAVGLWCIDSNWGGKHMAAPHIFDAILQYVLAVLVSYVLV